MRYYMMIIALAIGAAQAQTSAMPNSASQNTPVHAKAQLPKAQGLWIDVRSAEEYQAGHLEGAHNIVHTQIGEKITAISSDKNAPIHLYCKSGRRAEIARQTLLGMGYTNVINHGGYENLKNQYR